ncbi:MAG: aromatic ring-hydroxylating dioxygenase subunit alpha [Alphaproteobacteria bacterium]|nr:aromatic ring-hydroxylating dioxygenase subunit alpha [Alphaproteobacteria bacterium]
MTNDPSGTARQRNLKQPLGQYYRRRSPAPDRALTDAGPDTPGGEYLRRFWQPVALSSELRDLPVKVKIMGEDLVLFRDRSGRVGCLEPHCSHRGTSLEFGAIEERGLRCCYHGWLYDIDGTILETPNDPESTLKDRLCHGAYPLHEYKGLVFAYMGPPESKPEFPIYDVGADPAQELVPYFIATPCNWIQVFENIMDPVHGVFLHTRIAGTQFSDSFGDLPLLEFHESDIGMYYITPRRVGERVWVRMNDVILPNILRAGFIWEDGYAEKHFTRGSLLRWCVPVDDESCLAIGFRLFNAETDPAGKGDKRAVGKESVDLIGQTGERPYTERQRIPGDYDAQVSQRPIAVHALEHLQGSDRGLAMMRRLIRDGQEVVAQRHEPKCVRGMPGKIISTYCNDTVVRAPRRAAVDDDETLWRIGHAVASIVTDPSNGQGSARHERIVERVSALSEPALAKSAE